MYIFDVEELISLSSLSTLSANRKASNDAAVRRFTSDRCSASLIPLVLSNGILYSKIIFNLMCHFNLSGQVGLFAWVWCVSGR